MFIDGFDPTNTRGVQQIYEDYINAELTRTVNGTPTRVKFGDYMLNSEYDFVILDYKHGNDLMERNALTLVSLLERLYQTYGSTFQQDITIIGPSMGSEVAQYALAYMEHNNIPTHVKTYISFDGPQQGANVPIGLQNMVEYLTKRGLLSKLSAVKSNIRNGLYNGLAARQLIAHHVSANSQFPTPDALRTTFLNNLQAVGTYPSLCRKVAIIDGVSNGLLNPDHLTNNESLIHIINKRKGWKSIWGLCNANICKNVDWEVKGAPATGSARVMDMWTLNPVINLIFWVPPFETTKSASAAWGSSSQENAPGGRFQPIFGNFGGNVNQSKLTFDLTELFYLLTGSKRTTFTQNINSFTFIPSYSSADLRFPTMTDNSAKNLYMDWSQTYFCGHTPFDYVYAATDSNRQHVQVSQQISEWFESEVRCNRADLPVLFTPNIVGSSTLCTIQNYSLSFCQAGNHTVSWVSSNPGLATVSGSGDQISLTPHGQGTITLTATVNYPCIYSKPIVITKSNVAVGKPIVSGTYSYNGQSHPMQYYSGSSSYNSVCNSITANTNMQVTNATSVNWQRTAASMSSLTWNQNANDINFYFWSVGQTEVFRINATNACGTTSYDFGFKSIDCSGGGGCLVYQLSPNPAISTIQVGIVPNIPAPCDPSPTEQITTQEKPSNLSEISNTKDRSIQSISIYDSKGHLQQQQKYRVGNKQATLNVSNLPAGIYLVKITDGTFTEGHRVVIGK